MDEIKIIENTESAQKEFGHACGFEHTIITHEHIQALLDGKQLAFNDGEYAHFLSMTSPE